MSYPYQAAKFLLLNYAPMPVLHFLKKIHYARKLKSFPLESEPDVEVVRFLAGPGGQAVDIGANVGLYTMVLSGLVGGQGMVYSIEPVPETYDILRSNMRKLGLGNVITLNMAVSDASGRVVMDIPTHLQNAGNFYRARIVPEGCAAGQGREVQAQTMDGLFRKGQDRFSFVKCDVEGHELQCIRGARVFLERSDASWLIEVSGDPDDPSANARALFEEMSLKGYSAWWFDGRALREGKRQDGGMNYFFLKAGHVDALRQKAQHLFP